jgi:hypothetical protein
MRLLHIADGQIFVYNPTKDLSMATSRTSKAKATPSETYSVWRAYSPVNLVTEEGSLPGEVLPSLLKLTNFSSLKDLVATIKGHQRYELTEVLQKDLRKLFVVEVLPEAADEPCYFNRGRKPLELPYPFVARADAKAGKLQIDDFFIKQVGGKSGPLEIGGRFGIAVPKMLTPRTKADAGFCKLAALGDLCSEEAEDIQVVQDWLLKNSVPAKLAKEAAKDESFRWELRDQIHDRIERLVSVNANPKLFKGVNEELYGYFEGDEEKGFSK